FEAIHSRIAWVVRFLRSSSCSRGPSINRVGDEGERAEDEDDSSEVFPSEFIPMGPEQVFRSRAAGFFRSRPEQLFRSRAEAVFRSGSRLPFGPGSPSAGSVGRSGTDPSN